MIVFANVTYTWFHKFTHISVRMYLCMLCNVSMLCMYMHCCSNWFQECYSKLVSQTLFKISSTNLTQDWFHKYYSKFVPPVLLKIGSTSVTWNIPTNVTQNRLTNVTQNWFHKFYSKLVSQTLLKTSSTNVT